MKPLTYYHYNNKLKVERNEKEFWMGVAIVFGILVLALIASAAYSVNLK